MRNPVVQTPKQKNLRFSGFKQRLEVILHAIPAYRNIEVLYPTSDYNHIGLQGVLLHAMEFVNTPYGNFIPSLPTPRNNAQASLAPSKTKEERSEMFPYVYVQQEDLMLTEIGKEVDIHGVIATFKLNPAIIYLRFNRFPLNPRQRGDIVLDDVILGNNISCAPLVRTCNWYDNNHFTHTHLYIDWLHEIIAKHVYAPEFLFLRPANASQCKEHMKYYIYGHPGDDPYIFHLDGRFIAADSDLVKEHCPGEYKPKT